MAVSRNAAMQQMASDLGVTPFTPATGITQMVDALGGPGRGGGTAAAAAELGVSQRQVQRYLNFEQGKGGQARNPANARANAQGAKPLDTARETVKDATKAEIKAAYGGSINVSAAGELDYSETEEYRSISDVQVDVDGLDDWLDDALDDNWSAAADAFDEAFFDAYDFPGAGWGDYDELDIEPGY